eukprot:3940871-Pleurochrysis_carterae.AAC.3
MATSTGPLVHLSGLIDTRRGEAPKSPSSGRDALTPSYPVCPDQRRWKSCESLRTDQKLITRTRAVQAEFHSNNVSAERAWPPLKCNSTSRAHAAAARGSVSSPLWLPPHGLMYPTARVHPLDVLRHLVAKVLLVGLDVGGPRRDGLVLADPDILGHLLE